MTEQLCDPVKDLRNTMLHFPRGITLRNKDRLRRFRDAVRYSRGVLRRVAIWRYMGATMPGDQQVVVHARGGMANHAACGLLFFTPVAVAARIPSHCPLESTAHDRSPPRLHG